jgi:2-oxoglutarate ferredoxin oxidoreductase subunit alpha
LRHLNPFPANLGQIVKAYESVLVPEVNLGQLRKIVRSDFLVDAQGLNKVNGLPFRRVDIELAIISQLDALHHGAGRRQNNGHSEEQK